MRPVRAAEVKDKSTFTSDMWRVCFDDDHQPMACELGSKVLYTTPCPIVRSCRMLTRPLTSNTLALQLYGLEQRWMYADDPQLLALCKRQ